MKPLSQTAKDLLEFGQANTYENVIIGGVSRKSYLRSSTYSFGRDFSAASASVVLNNPNGIFSTGGSNEIREGDEIIIEEGVYLTDGSLEFYSGFTGIVKKPKVSKKGDNAITLDCVDYLHKLAGTDIDFHDSGAKIAIAAEELTPNYMYLYSGAGTYLDDYVEDTTQNWGVNTLEGLWLVDNNKKAYPIKRNTATRAYPDGIASGQNTSGVYTIGEGLAQIFDSEHDNWAQFPIPGIRVKNNADRVRNYNEFLAREEILTEWNGFNINYEHGQVILGLPIDAANYRVEADYSYYDTGLYAEDVLEDIITKVDGYGNVMFTVADHMTSKFSDNSRDSYDAMTPNYAPDTDPDLATTILQDIDADDTLIILRDPTGFRSPIPGDTAYLQIDQELMGYEGRDRNLVSGVSRGALGTPAQTHSRNARTYQAFPAGQLWFTKFNNLTGNVYNHTELSKGGNDTNAPVGPIAARYYR